MNLQQNNFTLLSGTFSEADAKEILTTLFADKIQFHRLKSFSHEERFGKPDPHAAERIPVLKKTLRELVECLNAFDSETHFEIHADITIKPVVYAAGKEN